MESQPQDRLEFIVKQLNIPENITAKNYPFYEINGYGNIFADISIATKAWRKVDKKVAGNIFPVINKYCKSPEECEAVLIAISGIES
jgi:hypothetical protein